MHKSFSAVKLNFNDNFLQKISNDKENSKNNIYDNNISLLKHKVFLEKLLHLIKIYQTEYLSKTSTNQKDTDNNKHNKIIMIKNILSNLKTDLIMTLKGNAESKAKMQNIMNNNKSDLVKNIFGYEKVNSEIKSKSDKKKKPLKISINNINDNEYIYNVELPHLKLLNFKIENQLKYMDVLIKLKPQSLNKFRIEFKFNEGKYYVFCDNQNDVNDASNCLHDNLINVRNCFKLIVKKKENQNRNLILLNSKVTSMKEEVQQLGKKSSNDYINTSDIINEESREYYTKTNVCTMENYKDLDLNKNFEDNNYIKKNLIRVNDFN